MSYGVSLPDLFRRSATYVHKILQGTKPSDLPVEQPTKFELVLNLKTASHMATAEFGGHRGYREQGCLMSDSNVDFKRGWDPRSEVGQNATRDELIAAARRRIFC